MSSINLSRGILCSVDLSRDVFFLTFVRDEYMGDMSCVSRA